jgi:hypothetical protein
MESSGTNEKLSESKAEGNYTVIVDDELQEAIFRSEVPITLSEEFGKIIY